MVFSFNKHWYYCITNILLLEDEHLIPFEKKAPICALGGQYTDNNENWFYLLLQEAAAAPSIYLQAPGKPCQYITYPENTSSEMPNYDTQIKSEEICLLPPRLFDEVSSITSRITSPSNNP